MNLLKKYSVIFNSVIWNTFGTILNSCISFLYLVIITRTNGVESSGIFSYCYSISLILYTFISYGGRTYQISDTSGEFSDSTYFNSKYVTCLIGILITLIYSFTMDSSINKNIIVFLLFLIRCIEAFSDVCYAVFQKNDRIDLIGKSLSIKVICCIISFWIVNRLTSNLILDSIAALITTYIVYLLYDKKKIKEFMLHKEKFEFSESVRLLKVCKFFCFFNLIVNIIANIPRIFVEKFFSDYQQGYFGIIIMIPTVMTLLGYIILQPLMMRIIDSFKNKEYKKLKKIIVFLFGSVVIATIVCEIGFVICGCQILTFIYQMDFSEYKTVIIITILAGTFNVFTIFLSNLLTILRCTKQQIYLYIVVVCIGMILLKEGAVSGFTNLFINYFFMMIMQAIIFFIYFVIKIRSEIKNEKN